MEKASCVSGSQKGRHITEAAMKDILTHTCPLSSCPEYIIVGIAQKPAGKSSGKSRKLYESMPPFSRVVAE
jgi:hypothetical protein